MIQVAAAQQQSTAIPAGTVLQIRLRQTLSSYTTKPGTPIEAEVIAPVEVNGRTLLPMRTELLGIVRDARKVGLGFSRDTALLHLEFNRIQVPGRPEQELRGAVTSVDDARERVDAQGRIRGIRATDSFSSVLAGAAIAVSSFDPLALIFGLSSSLGIFRVPDSTIILPAGSELKFTIGASLQAEGVEQPQYPELFTSGQVRTSLAETVRSLPYRTATKGDGTPSDLTSLLYIGSRESIQRAFLAAGWVRADQLDAQSTFGVMRSIVENQGYRAAPMSVLVLNEKEPELAFAKTLNTFFSRHHLRIYSQQATHAGLPVWTSTATYDSGVGFSRGAKTFIHLINENIDEERGKVVNDLVLTGCVEGVGYLDRPWVPLDAKNSTGDRLRTDGRIAILKLNDCASPRRAADEQQSREGKVRQSAYLRPVRAALLTLRNDFTRGNIVYQGYQGARMGLSLFQKPKVESAGPRSLHFGGQDFLIVEGAAPVKAEGIPPDAGHRLHQEQRARAPKSYVHRLLFSINGGLSGYGNTRFSTQRFTFSGISAEGKPVQDPLTLDTGLARGWTIAPRITLNSWKYVSNEFSYSRTSTNFLITGQDQLTGTKADLRSKAAIRRFTYNALIHLQPNGRRVRPYLAAGPAFQLIHLMEAQPQKAGLLRFVARDAVLFLTAYDFGTKPPLEGGGVFQAGLDYGGGVKVHVTPRLFLRADFRETLSAQPDFWKTTPQVLQRQTNSDTVRLDYSPLVKHGPLRHQVVTMGIGVSF